MDYGYPQLTAVTILKAISYFLCSLLLIPAAFALFQQDLIKHGTVKSGFREGEEGPPKDPNVITSEVTGSVDWRQPVRDCRFPSFAPSISTRLS